MVSRFISERALAETYDTNTGWKTVNQYREAIRLAEEQPDLARAEIARRVNRSPSAIRGWLAENKTPPVVKGLETAQKRGWLDIESDSETFRVFNQLVAWIFSGGGINQAAFVPTFSADDQLTVTTLTHLLKWVNIPFHLRTHNEDNRHIEVIPAEDASVFGRVLTALGAPCGPKARQDSLTLPKYLHSVEEEFQRDFARVYLLNRGSFLSNQRTVGTYLQESSEKEYKQSLRDLFASITAGSATLGSQHQVWVSADSVRDLADGSPLRSALATRVAFGTLTPPSNRAFASTFRQQRSPGGYQYLQLYRRALESDSSRGKLANQLGLPETTIQSWRRGSSPYVHNALSTAHERGWLTASSDDDIPLALTAILAWIFSQGSIRAESYYPIFRLSSPDQRSYFETIADDLDLSYSIIRSEDPTRSTEVRPIEDGTVLGRVLHILGAPLSESTQQISLPPVYLYHYPEHAHRFITIWMKQHSDPNGQLTLTVPPRLGKPFADALEALMTEQLSWSTTRNSECEIGILPKENP
ncbi:hypothetical protein [Haloplanus halophilus]|uniref:hypothetical protein n=1 Tax=Haloplanus halophilus TaxID=2949993 RepID=UPI00203CBB4F|nr:hypothetical protein [Haloplanus sp. GDY1]